MKWKPAAAAAVACALAFGSLLPTAAEAAGDRTSKFRVYQNANALREFSDRNQAIAYAQSLKNAYVEQIGTRAWVWNNFPQFKVYQNDKSMPEWEFATPQQAIAEAKKWANSSVRKLSDGGWVWHNYPDNPGFTLYQNGKTLPNWTFPTLAKAQQEAKKWANAYVIDNATNRWAWDNIPAARKAELRSGSEAYRVYQSGKTLDNWGFAYIEDAIKEAGKWANSTVVRTGTQTVVFSNVHRYAVHQNGAKTSTFPSLAQAIAAASKLSEASILWDGKRIWSNETYYKVLQSGKMLQGFGTPAAAAAYANGFANSEVVTLEGVRIWDNMDELVYLAWNGTSKHDTIVGHVSNTQGLDIDSPTWFYLEDASGALKDESDPRTVEWLKTQGVEVHPLVHNQFDAKLTSAFLANEAAQKKFIESLVNRLVALQADGVNIDFESLAGSDRDRYTAFVKALSEAARAKGLTVSIDLPRGSAAWNHLTAFDHEKLHQYVDYVAIMTYDQFYRGSESPGPVAGMSWTEQGVTEFLSYGIPRSKLLLGVPFYIRVWELDASGKLVGNRAIWMKDIEAAMAGAQVTRTEDPNYGLTKVEYAKDGKRYVFWMEDIASIKKRVELAKTHDLAGVAAWRLGYEPAELWTELLRAK
ncbi:glycosyl hydrolase family 18 protein [Paenibacillus sp.]|uniref:glycosyl hydrolase family 18 protein n=1 Tax=Paenibacillus sp. TaxID=58172 RepID=UPI002D68A6DA|nr:glycosyl hydrolase family 18 protein [Paenibacillus sp.]HZG85376.1 glycosyl hydrolase family 18 protein [Paenibacillus sp.]